ncbi:unnamed protein product [Didymodactylos carnosus]|uniref:ABC transporter domain-containing protein n=1 Tax=Didymodactylos carnosus TaxID=1234261 RepID=A0A814ITU6_9BILA|nr:unnamed protein product [Didymodactylos carnosus]CAF3799296.1 unnamed protein product [Didymodactylos carnosus]
MHKSMPSANVTAALVHALSLIGLLQWFIRLGTEILLQMTAVERVNEYCHLPVEELKTNEPPKPHWPEEGQITFENLSFRYSVNSPWILNKIDLFIQPGEKIGIVGRTGAGKSSIIQALFRMADLEGKILIDGIDTKSISLNSLRNRISIIPQVQLKPMIIRLPSGLSHQITEGGTNFSVGQRQLICLVRALLRRNKILVIDEATANVDMKTDNLIQQSIRQKFKNCTVLTIAHRLRTVIDNDKILVLSNGCIVEFDHPYLLLCDTNSYFYEMISQGNKSEAHGFLKQSKRYYEKGQHLQIENEIVNKISDLSSRLYTYTEFPKSTKDIIN